MSFARLLLLLTACVVAAAARSVHSPGTASARRGFSSPPPPCSASAASAAAVRSAASVPTAFSTTPSAFRGSVHSPRPSTVVPALPNRFGHDRLSLSPFVCGQHSTTANRRFRLENRLQIKGRSACTKICARQDLKEDVLTLSTSESSEEGSFTDESIDIDEAILSTLEEESIANDTVDGIPKEFIPILALCFLVTLLSALDRVAMSIAILPISSEFGYTETIKGQISSAVSYGYGLAILPIGLAVSVVSSRLLMLVGVFLWSLATLGTPLMAELSNSGVAGDATAMFLLPLILIRAVMGAAEAVVLPTMQRILANWVPPEKKATVLAIVISGFQLGTVGAYLVSPLILDFMSGLDGGPADIPGWRGMFYLYGMAGLLWMVPWSIIAKDAPAASEVISEDEDCEETLVNSMIEDDASLVLAECELEPNADGVNPTSRIQEMQTLLKSAPWMDFVKSKGVWGMTLAHAAKNFELYNLLAWTPSFFSDHYGLNVKESAIYSVLPSICGMVGGLTAGSTADYVLSRVCDDDRCLDIDDAAKMRTQVRKLFQGIALLGPATCLYLLSSLPEQASTAQILLGGAVGLQAFDAAGFGAATQEKAGERWAGLLYSLTSLPGVMVGSISVSITGQLLDMMADKNEGWTVVYQLNSVVCVVGALFFLFLYDSKKEFE